MTEQFDPICPKCKSTHVSFLAIGAGNPYMYGCQECYHQWNEEDEEIAFRLEWSPTPSPNDKD